MANKTLAGVVQLTSGADLTANLRRCRELVIEAASRGAKLVVLPENFALLGEDERAKFAVAERLDANGPILSSMRDLARREHVALVLGGMPEIADAAGTHVYNTAVYLDEVGEIRSIYRKIHLFDVAIPDGASYRESATVKPGAEVVLAPTPWGPLGMSVCYDVRFAELYRAQAKKGARMLVVPAAFTLHTGRSHWHVLLRARAIENLAYVLAAAQYGRHNAKRVTYGHSCIVDPWGQILAEVGDREGVAVAELDFDYQDRLRHELPALNHIRL
jgi:predicted amidohydrolase